MSELLTIDGYDIYERLALDVWGNAEDGYITNGAYHTGQYYAIGTNVGAESLLDALGYTADDHMHIDWTSEYAIFIEHEDGHPAEHFQRLTTDSGITSITDMTILD